MRLTDKSIVVTGGASGLGRAMTTAFVREGAHVLCADIDADGLDGIERELADADVPGSVAGIEVDVTSWELVQRMIDTALETFGHIDVLVNNAGLTPHLSGGGDDHVIDLPVEKWDATLDVNLRGPFLCTKAALPSMLERGAGQLLFLSSGFGEHGGVGAAAYAASKFGIEGFCESLVLEIEETGLAAIVLKPPGGGVFTESKAARGEDADRYPHRPSVIQEAAIQVLIEGKNGGRYMATADGEGYVEAPRE